MIRKIVSLILFSLILKCGYSQKSLENVKEFLGKESFDKTSQETIDYLVFKAENLVLVKLMEKDKLISLPKIKKVDVIDKTSNKTISYSANDFIKKFNQSEINPLLIKIKRNRDGFTNLRLGDSDYMVQLKSEEEIAKKYNNLRKK